LLYEEHIRQGHLPAPMGKGEVAPVALQDLCEVVINVAKTCHVHLGEVYILTGPELVTGESIAKLLSEFTHSHVSYRSINEEEAKQILEKAKSLTEVERELLLEMYHCIREGCFDLRTDQVERLTGHPARHPREVFKLHRNELTTEEECRGEKV